MNDDPSRRRLGRGLAALIGEIGKPEEQAAGTVPAQVPADRSVPIEFITPNPRNPRRSFAEGDLGDLAQSIREHGLVQPLVVRPAAEAGRYELIAGERRWRAAQRAGLTSVPVVVRAVDDRTALELAIVENVQRSDLNPVEEALGYNQLIEEHGYSQADLGQVIGKSRSHVANTLRLLKLPEIVREMLVSGTLSAGHARTLVTAADPVAVARRIIEEGLSVRQAEMLAQNPVAAPPQGKAASNTPRQPDSDTAALEKMLSDATGLSVSIRARQDGSGEVRIAYRTLDQLDEVARRLQA